MEHTKGELEIFISKYGFHKICRKDGIGHKDILDDVSSEEAIANFQELVRRWNAFEKDGLLDELRAACEKVQDWLDTSSLQQVLVHYTKDKRKHALIMGIATNLERLEAAIAKVKA